MSDTQIQDGRGSNEYPVRVLVVDDEKLIRWSVKKHLEKEGFDVTAAESGEDALEKAPAFRPDVVLLDVRLPGIDGLQVLRQLRIELPDAAVIMLSAHGNIGTAVQAMKTGAVDFIPKPFDLAVVEATVRRSVENLRLRRQIAGLTAERQEKQQFVRLVGGSPAMEELRDLVGKVARSDATTALIRGESGSGKEVIARLIHSMSRRSERPFITINCTSIPEQLVESELLGYERGAFTDAKTQKKGLFEVADKGTLLLDEIGDMPLGAQAKLLRLLEDKTFKRVGGTTDLRVDVRVLASTHRNVSLLVEQEKFRQDLFFRLNIMSIEVPPLRSHVEDLEELASHFITLYNAEFKREVAGITSEALGMMRAYRWPGNVRELRNVIERAFILEPQDEIAAEHLPPEVRAGSRQLLQKETSGPKAPAADAIDLNRMELHAIRDALERASGNQTRAAKLLGISRDALRYRLKKFNLH